MFRERACSGSRDIAPQWRHHEVKPQHETVQRTSAPPGPSHVGQAGQDGRVESRVPESGRRKLLKEIDTLG